MLIKLAILAALFMPSIMAALLHEEIAKTLIAENEEELVQTFKKFEKEHDKDKLSWALVDVAKAQEHMPKIATCLRTVDPFPDEMSHVSRFVHNTLFYISDNTDGNAESFAKVITAFQPSDVKPLASIRYITLLRSDAVKVVESVMDKSPTLITDDLPRWLADHLFDQESPDYTDYGVTREQTFQYLTLFATERVLKVALSIVKANQHYKANSQVLCCKSHHPFPQDLCNKLETLLAFVKARNAYINEALMVLPKVLADMVAEYLPASTN